MSHELVTFKPWHGIKPIHGQAILVVTLSFPSFQFKKLKKQFTEKNTAKFLIGLNDWINKSDHLNCLRSLERLDYIIPALGVRDYRLLNI